MKAKVKIWIIIVGLIIGGISYWFQPYNQTTVLGIHIYLILSVGAFLGALFPGKSISRRVSVLEIG